MSPIKQTTALDHPSSIETSSKDVPLTAQPVWEMEMVMEHQQGSPAAAFSSVPSEDEAEEAEDLRQGRDREEEEIRTVPHGYERVTATASLTDKLEKVDEDSVLTQSLSGSVPLGSQPELSVPPPTQEQSELFDPQTLQTVVTSCEIPDQRTALEGSQVCDQDVGTHWGVYYLFSRMLKLFFFSIFSIPSWLSSPAPATRPWHQRASSSTWAAGTWRKSPALSSGVSPTTRFARLTQSCKEWRMKTPWQVRYVPFSKCIRGAESKCRTSLLYIPPWIFWPK